MIVNKLCKCGRVRGKSSRRCNPCNAAGMRKWRKAHVLTPEQKLKDNCRSYAGVYLRRGKLVKEPCRVCQSAIAQMHHEDYNKPLNVVWLCRQHHLLLHKMSSVKHVNSHLGETA